jgi:hypothetical protein
MMPAFLLILRIGKVTVPLPWFLIWLLAIPFAILGWFVGNIALFFFPDSYFMRAAANAWRAVLCVMFIGGLKVKVDSSEEKVLVQFI